MRASRVLLFGVVGVACGFPGFFGSELQAGGSSPSKKVDDKAEQKRLEAAAAAVDGTGILYPKPQSNIGNGVPQEAGFSLRKVGYLATVGPAPMRFTSVTPGASERTPPRVPASSNKGLSGGPVTPPPQVGSEFSTGPEGTSYRVKSTASGGGFGTNTSGLSGGATEEILRFFGPPQPADEETQRAKNRFMFDPSPNFQSAPPPQLDSQGRPIPNTIQSTRPAGAGVIPSRATIIQTP